MRLLSYKIVSPSLWPCHINFKDHKYFGISGALGLIHSLVLFLSGTLFMSFDTFYALFILVD